MTRLSIVLMTLCALVASLCSFAGAWLQRAHRHPLFRPGVAVAALLLMAWLQPAVLAVTPLVIGAVLTEGMHTAEFLITEQPGKLSRDTVTVRVNANTTLAPGTVLGKITASGKYVPFDDASSDGRENAAGILYAEVANDTIAAADFVGVIINFGAEVRNDHLQWEDGVDETAGKADLAALFIKARSSS